MDLAADNSHDDARRLRDECIVTSVALWGLLIIWVIASWAFYFAMPVVHRWAAMQVQLEHQEQVLQALQAEARQPTAVRDCAGAPPAPPSPR
ncbi:hypothetical protein E4L96_02865 [Massilia arenosa]|uniref:Uncharacterized protein n=1 Tax=Zemynaea arenosa TaxID=2561931 RepID=A0A4Y9SNX6_9BURK|nr:hypothetical protein [Massilia arenosa]TFW28201.1 hypothetical protein E4L96_02865 [Massilia arenosa]